MSRDTKIILAFIGISLAIEAAKAKVQSPDAMLEVVKADLVPLLMSTGALYGLLKLVK